MELPNCKNCVHNTGKRWCAAGFLTKKYNNNCTKFKKEVKK